MMNYATNYVKLEDAFKELPSHAFSYFIRLMMLRDHELVGRRKLAEIMGVPVASSDRALRELSLVGYVECVNNGAGKKTTIKIIKRIAVFGFSRIVRL